MSRIWRTPPTNWAAWRRNEIAVAFRIVRSLSVSWARAAAGCLTIERRQCVNGLEPHKGQHHRQYGDKQKHNQCDGLHEQERRTRLSDADLYVILRQALTTTWR